MKVDFEKVTSLVCDNGERDIRLEILLNLKRFEGKNTSFPLEDLSFVDFLSNVGFLSYVGNFFVVFKVHL